MIDLKGDMPRFILKMNVFSIYLLGNPLNVCWNPQNRACFSKMIDLSGHMPRFTLKMNVSLAKDIDEKMVIFRVNLGMWPLKSIMSEKQALFWGFQHTFMDLPRT